MRMPLLRLHPQPRRFSQRTLPGIEGQQLFCAQGERGGDVEGIEAAMAAFQGHRSLDTLHVATALALGAKGLLTFDARQTALAKAAGLRVNLK